MTGDVKNHVARPVLVSLADELEITDEVINYCLRQHARNQARCRVLDDYYHNENAIKGRVCSDPDKPNNKISHAFARYITKVATAYFMGYGVRYSCTPKAYKKELDRILEDNLTQIKHFEEAKEMSKQGVAFELLFIDPDGRLRSKYYAADELLPVYSQTPGHFLTLALRPYQIESISSRAPCEKFVELYDSSTVSTYHSKRGGAWELLERFSHNFSDVPVIVRCNNAELESDYEDVLPQIDAYDKAQSDTSNDLDYFTDAYLVLEGLDSLAGEDEEGNELNPETTARVMKQNRMIYTPKDCKAGFITKEGNDTQTEHHKDRLRKDTFFLSQVPNLTDEEFAGNLSGVAIKYKLFGLEELSIEKETYFTSSELKKVRLITEYINALKNTSYDWRTVTLKFDRSAVANTYEIAQIMNLLRDILSDETLIAMFPGVKDAAAELERRLTEQQNAENSGLPPDSGVFA